jgi:hypothetical protein
MLGDQQTIRLPQKVREDMGLFINQFLQLSGKEVLVLQVKGTPDATLDYACVSLENFEKIKGKSVEFSIPDVTLGCDPEFFIMWDKTLMSAATYLPFQGQIGSDGTLGELRPSYARHEDGVVANLTQLIPRITGKMCREKWATGFPRNGDKFRVEAHSYYRGLAAGFHIHLGIPPEILNTRTDFSRIAMNHLVQCLDWYVSVPMIPLEVNPNRRAAGTSYGNPGDYRPSNLTLEYRTPGAFYLRTPKLARGLLGLCLMVTETVVSRMKTASNNFVNLHRLSKDDLNDMLPVPQASVIKKTLLDRNSQTGLSYLEGIQESLCGLSSYAKHEQSVSGFFREVESRRVPGPNLIENWKVEGR